MNTNPVLRAEERVYTLWAVEDSICDVLAAANNVRQALDSGDLQHLLPTGEARLQHIQHETTVLLEELIGLKHDYEAQITQADTTR